MTRRRQFSHLAAAAAAALLLPLIGASPSVGAAAPVDDTPVLLTPKGEAADEFYEVDEAHDFAKLRDAYFESELLAGDDEDATIEEAAQLRNEAITASHALSRVSSATAAETVGGPWQSIGPDPTVQIGRTTNTAQAVSGRVGALVVRNNGDIILGAAQGGVWTYSEKSGTWTSRTDNTATQAVGALAIAPSNDAIVYMGSGEGALSGDSYYGDGVYRSADGGKTWTHVSGDFFVGNSTSDIVVDPANPNHLYIATLRGRGGIRRTTPPSSQQYGIWESKDGGATWTLLKGTNDEFAGATDLVMDPKDSRTLWASFWGDGIYRSTDGGATWAKAMAGLPTGQFLAGATRFSLGISRPSSSKPAVLYTGFDYFDASNVYHTSKLWKTSGGTVNWTPLPTGGPTSDPDSIADYCTTQCFYDNVITVDPRNSDIVYVAGSYGYDQSPQSGGIYRSMDGGQTWKSLGYDLHPDFHAVALQPSQPSHIVIGNDGGVWQSSNRGGRLADGAPLSAAQWENLNGTVTPAGAFVRSTGLRIGQLTSIATVPTTANQYWAGTQDNGTQRKSIAAGAAGFRWFDQPSGDGGQVLVDPTNGGYVFGTFNGITPYRFTPTSVNQFFGQQNIRTGLNLGDRAEFYVPWVMNKANPNQLFLGTYRLYRTNNAETASSGDVRWQRISGDLTTGCGGTAPNGARGCFLSAIGMADGGDAVYTGSDDGKLFVNEHAVSGTFDAAHPNAGWTDITGDLPNRPVSQFAVDRSNWRIAYVSFTGFRANTPTTPGSVFKTTDGGEHWTDITSDLPDSPVNSLLLDPAFPGTLYAGTDIGAYVSTDNGGSWHPLGTGMPKVSVWQLDFDAGRRLLAAGTHGRGAYTLTDAANQAAPALIVSKVDSGKPVGPGTAIDYTITVRNIGNADATGVSVSDPVPAHTSYVAGSADHGGSGSGGSVTWSGLSVPAGGSLDVHFSARIDQGLDASITQIVDDGIEVTGANVHGTVTGSPQYTHIAPQYALAMSPASQAGGARVGQSATYSVTVTNNGYGDDTYDVSASGSWPSAVFAADCTTAVTSVAVSSGHSAQLCVKVDVPAAAADGAHSGTALTATSQGDPSVSAGATVTTFAAAAPTLLVDNDGGGPNVEAIYKKALDDAGVTYGYWDLGANADLPASYLAAYDNVVWFTGNSYPAPITRYESALAGFLDGGGHLLMSGQDLLDQAAGTTAFVKNYLHIDWDGSETQNDKATNTVTSVAGNPVSDGIGTVPIDHTVLGANFEDQITPITPATPAFTDSAGQADALTVSVDGYKVEFLAFPLEAYGTAAQKADLVHRTFTWFATP